MIRLLPCSLGETNLDAIDRVTARERPRTHPITAAEIRQMYNAFLLT